jgi:hypothetical protein
VDVTKLAIRVVVFSNSNMDEIRVEKLMTKGRKEKKTQKIKEKWTFFSQG